MSFRFASLPLAFAALAAAASLGVASEARAQTAASAVVAITNKDSLPRLDGNGGTIANNDRRQDPANREGINLADCRGDQSIVFPLTVVGFAPGDLAEVWATNGSTDCGDPQFRPGTQSVHCTKVGTFALTNTTQATIKAKTLLSATGVTTLDSFGCPAVDISSVTVYFMILRGGAATAAFAKDSVPIKVDTQGPVALTGVRVLPGNQALTVSWDSVGEAGAQDVIGAQALCDPAPSGASATDAGSTTTCTVDGAAVSIDASDDAAVAEAGATCTTVANDAGTTASKIPSASGIGSDGVACNTQAFSTSTAVPCGSISGTTGNTIRIDAINGVPLQNGVVYAVAVAGTDSFQNVGSVSSPSCQFPESTSDFWRDYRGAGGTAGGGCAVETAGVPLGSFTLLVVGGVVVLSTLRRRAKAKGARRNVR